MMNTPLPDTIWTYGESGNRLYGVPNYAKPGVAERVARECFEAECAADPPRDSLGRRIRIQEIIRFERSQKASQSC
jgi:hypothetical protein